MRNTSLVVGYTLLCLTWAVVPANADQHFQASLTGSQQVPVVASTAIGIGTVVLNPAETQITVNMSFAGLTSNVNGAHIHFAAAGTNGPILFDFAAVTPAATSGAIPEQTFAITPTQVANLKAGLFYFNIHTANFPGGEIRGQITAAAYTFLTLAGQSSAGSADGVGAAARFLGPYGVAVDLAGNVYVADTSNYTIRKITPAGSVTTLAGLAGTFGSTNGTGTAARFAIPDGVAVDAAGTVYVADASVNRIRMITAAGVVTTLAGTGAPGAADGAAGSATFSFPTGVAVDSAGAVYVADRGNHKIRKISAGIVSTLAGSGSPGGVDGTGTAATFNNPWGVAAGAGGVVFVADHGNHTIRKITAAGVVTTLAGLAGTSGSANGTGAAARFSNPSGVSLDAAGNVYVADTGSSRIRMVTPAGVVTTLAGTGNIGSVDGTGAVAQFFNPQSVASTAAGAVYVADTSNNTIRKITGGAVSTLAGLTGSVGSTDGARQAARFYEPEAVAVDSAGTIYVGDTSNKTIRKMTRSGAVTTLAGVANSSGGTDGTGSAARFSNPSSFALDAAGTLYVTDSSRIRKVTAAGVVTTFAGGSTSGSVDGTGTAARFSFPGGITVDSAGIVYVADTNNHTIRSITAAGVVTTLAGSAGISGSTDGSGALARFNHPTGIAMSSAGLLYVVDGFNYTVRTVTTAGVVGTLAGSPGISGTSDGVGALARFFIPTAVAVDSSGNAYVTDYTTIRMITPGAVVSTIAGGGIPRQGSADGAGTAAQFNNARGIAMDTAGHLYVADTSSNTIRQGVLGTPVAPLITTQPSHQTVSASPTTVAQFGIAAAGMPAPGFQWQASADGGTVWTNLTDSATYFGVNTATLLVSVPTSAISGYRFRAVVSNGAGSQTSNAATLTAVSMTAGPATLYFAATRSGPSGALIKVTPCQDIVLSFTGPGASWTVAANQAWIQLPTASGSGSARFSVCIANPGNVLAGLTNPTATITVTVAGLNLATASVNLIVKESATSALPFGSFDTPVSSVTALEGSFAVTGWALDDVGIDRVEIWRDRVAGETTPVFAGGGPGNGKIFIANPFFVTGARADVEALYSTNPFASRAGWGYLLLSWGLWNQGNGPFTLYAFAYDVEGNVTTLGTKSIVVNNAAAQRPFGGIDVPGYGATMSGAFQNFGWALTPNHSPTCTIIGGNVSVSIDSGPLVPVIYGGNRVDIAAAFPGFSNGTNAGGAFAIDSTTFANGTHQIGWYVVDSCARAEGIGSRFFTVLNAGGQVARGSGGQEGRQAESVDDPIEVRRGVDTTVVYPSAGTRTVAIGQSERVEVRLPSAEGASYTGYQVVNDERRALPLGSSLDAEQGIFYWQPGNGFLGPFSLEFVSSNADLVRVRAVVGTSVQAAIDTPFDFAQGRPLAGATAGAFMIAGWAIDLAATGGTGIDAVHVWAYPATGASPIFLGEAAYGEGRPDIGALFGAQFTGSSFSLPVAGLAPGTYDLVVYPHSSLAGDFRGAQMVRVFVR